MPRRRHSDSEKKTISIGNLDKLYSFRDQEELSRRLERNIRAANPVKIYAATTPELIKLEVSEREHTAYDDIKLRDPSALDGIELAGIQYDVPEDGKPTNMFQTTRNLGRFLEGYVRDTVKAAARLTDCGSLQHRVINALDKAYDDLEEGASPYEIRDHAQRALRNAHKVPRETELQVMAVMETMMGRLSSFYAQQDLPESADIMEAIAEDPRLMTMTHNFDNSLESVETFFERRSSGLPRGLMNNFKALKKQALELTDGLEKQERDDEEFSKQMWHKESHIGNPNWPDEDPMTGEVLDFRISKDAKETLKRYIDCLREAYDADLRGESAEAAAKRQEAEATYESVYPYLRDMKIITNNIRDQRKFMDRPQAAFALVQATANVLPSSRAYFAERLSRDFNANSRLSGQSLIGICVGAVAPQAAKHHALAQAQAALISDNSVLPNNPTAKVALTFLAHALPDEAGYDAAHKIMTSIAETTGWIHVQPGDDSYLKAAESLAALAEFFDNESYKHNDELTPEILSTRYDSLMEDAIQGLQTLTSLLREPPIGVNGQPLPVASPSTETRRGVFAMWADEMSKQQSAMSGYRDFLRIGLRSDEERPAASRAKALT